MGVRATGRSFGKPHSTILRGERRLAEQTPPWSSPAPQGADVTVEGDEVYTRVSDNLPPVESEGWTIHFIEQKSRYWVAAQAGQKVGKLFEPITASAWAWAAPGAFGRWFSDGEQRALGNRVMEACQCAIEDGRGSPWLPTTQGVARRVRSSDENQRVAGTKASGVGQNRASVYSY